MQWPLLYGAGSHTVCVITVVSISPVLIPIVGYSVVVVLLNMMKYMHAFHAHRTCRPLLLAEQAEPAPGGIPTPCLKPSSSIPSIMASRCDRATYLQHQ